MDLPIVITSVAQNEIINLMKIKGLDPSLGLRIGIEGSGCSGTRFILGFDKPTEHDKVFEWNQIKIIINKKHFLYLAGMKLDFVERMHERGFTFESV